MPYRSWCEYCVRGRGKESPHLSRHEQADDGIPVVQMDYAFLHDTGDNTFLTMVDNVERAHQSVEAMVRTMKEVIEDKAKTKLNATDSITTWMKLHAAFLRKGQQNTI